MGITRRNALASGASSVVGLSGLAGCLMYSDHPDVEWLDAGVRDVELTDVISLSAYVTVENRSGNMTNLTVELRLLDENENFLTEWTKVRTEDIPHGKSAVLSTNYELSRGSFMVPNDDLIAVKDGMNVIFRQAGIFADDSADTVYTINDSGEPVEYEY